MLVLLVAATNILAVKAGTSNDLVQPACLVGPPACIALFVPTTVTHIEVDFMQTKMP